MTNNDALLPLIMEGDSLFWLRRRLWLLMIVDGGTNVVVVVVYMLDPR